MPFYTDVRVELNGVVYINNSIVDINEIGADSESLLCITTNEQCCTRSLTANGVAAGQWYLPNNGPAVGKELDGGNFYRDRGERVVRLHRRNNAMTPTGSFCCEIPAANGTIERVCVTINATLMGK